MPRDRVMVDLRGLGAALRSHCQQQGIPTLSAFIVPVIAEALQAPTPSHRVRELKAGKAGRRKVSVFLDEASHDRLRAKAKDSGLTLSRYMASVAESDRLPEVASTKLSPEALAAFVQSNYELRAIGRNINQIAHSLNTFPGKITSSERAQLDDLSRRLDEHVRCVARALATLNPPKRSRRERAA